jgi:hypothetical protein
LDSKQIIVNKILNNRALILISIFILTCCQTWSQLKTELWTRILIGHEFNKKFSIEGDYQYRWQTDHNNQNLFDNKLGELRRMNFIYRLNENFVFGLAPFSNFKNHKLILNQGDELAPPSNEFRHILNIEYSKSINSKAIFQIRSSNEYRTFTTSSTKIFRTRVRAGIRYNLNNQHSFRLANEVLLNAYSQDARFFDQYRIISDYFFRIYKNYRFNVAHILNFRKRKDQDKIIYENIINLGTLWSI